MKKVLFLNNVVYPIYDLLLPQLQKNRQYEPSLLILSGEQKGAWNYRQQFKSQIEYPFSLKLTIPLAYDKFTLYINPTILMSLVRIDPDIIVIAGWDQPSYIVAFFYGKLFGKKVILWTGSTAGEESFMRTVTRPFVKFMLRHIDYIVAYGAKSRDYLLSLGNFREKIFSGYYICDNNFFSKKSRELFTKKRLLRKKFGIPNKLTFLYIGQIIKRKGLDLLLEAFYYLKKAEVSLVICGEGEEKEKLKKLISRRKIRNVYFINSKRSKQLPEIYNLADVFILPSLVEVWGLVVNEAMASGLPVVVSKYAGSAADLVKKGENGFVFDPKNPDELVKIINYFINNPHKIKIMGRKSRKIIRSYDINRLTHNFCLAFQHALSV